MEKLLHKQCRNCFRNNGEITSETIEKIASYKMEKLPQKQWRNYLINNGEIAS